VLPDILIIFGLILVNGLFAGAEIAVLTVRRSRLQEMVDRGSRRARAVQWLRGQPERFLATVQVGITVVGATSAVYGGEFLTQRLASGLTDLGAGSYADHLAFVLVVGSISYLSLVLGELVPKSLALRHADRYATIVGRPLVLLSQFARPLVWLLTASSNVVLRIFRDETSFTESRVSRDELRSLVEEAAQTGAIDPHSSEIATRAIGFGQLTVGLLMVPRSEIDALPRHAPADEVKRALLERGRSRMPVYDGTLDHVVGYVTAKDILALSWEAPLIILEDILRPILLVRYDTLATDVLRELQKRRTQLALVRDDQNEVIGLVTAEDIVEELVGEIFSEDEVAPIRKQQDGTVLARGTVPIREVNRELDVELPQGDTWTTVAGLVTALADSIPEPGWTGTAPDGTVIEVIEASPRRVLLVRLRPKATKPPPTPAPPT